MIGFLARTTSRLSRESCPPSRAAKALDLGKADIFEQASELGRGMDAEPERAGAARSVGRGQYVLGFNLAGLGGAGSGRITPAHLVSRSSECHHR